MHPLLRCEQAFEPLNVDEHDPRGWARPALFARRCVGSPGGPRRRIRRANHKVLARWSSSVEKDQCTAACGARAGGRGHGVVIVSNPWFRGRGGSYIISLILPSPFVAVCRVTSFLPTNLSPQLPSHPEARTPPNPLSPCLPPIQHPP